MIYVTERGCVWSRHRLLKRAADKARAIRRNAEKNRWCIPSFELWEIQGKWEKGDNPPRHYWTYKYGEITFTERIDQIK